MEEKRTAFGRTPTDKAWQELKRHRQQMQSDSTRIIDEIGRLEREVASLQARLEEERYDRSVQHQVAIVIDDTLSSVAVDNEAPTYGGESTEATTGSVATCEAATSILDHEDSEAFDIFFGAPDDDRENDQKFLLD